jgi:hypothetical protein
MKSDRNEEVDNLKALVSLWRQEEGRLRFLLKHPGTSPSIRGQASGRLGAVLDQIQVLTDERRFTLG